MKLPPVKPTPGGEITELRREKVLAELRDFTFPIGKQGEEVYVNLYEQAKKSLAMLIASGEPKTVMWYFDQMGGAPKIQINREITQKEWVAITTRVAQKYISKEDMPRFVKDMAAELGKTR